MESWMLGELVSSPVCWVLVKRMNSMYETRIGIVGDSVGPASKMAIILRVSIPPSMYNTVRQR